VATWAERAYRPLLEFSLLSPKRVLAAALAFVVVACAILPSLGRVFLPEFREKSLVNSMVLYPGVSLEMTNRAGLALAKTLKASPLFEWVQVRSGRAPGDADGAGVNLAHVDVELSDAAMKNRPAAIAQLREAFLKLPGAPNIGGFISHRMDEVLSGVRSAIAIKIYGPDLAELRRIGERVRDAIEPIPGVVDLQLEPQLPIQQVQIAFDRQAATANGLTMAQLSEAVEIALNGKTVGQVVSDGTDRTDVVVLLPEDSRNNLDALRAIPIATPAGTMLPLGSLARIDYGLGANVVNREDVSRLIVVSTNVSGRPLGTVVADIQNTIDSKIKLPSGYLIRYGGQFESEERATANLLLYSLLALVVIALLMFVAVKSLPATLAILINLPLALVGGLVAILLTGGVLSVASLIGFITLFGVAVRNGLLLVDNYNRRHAEGMELKEVIRAGSLQRLNAILMTALTSALGTLPLALAFGAGNEILQPLAIVVLGGLITSTILTLLVLPALYARFGAWLLPLLKPVLSET
jgi:nickel/cobalt tolerance cation efflux system protein